MNCSTAVYGAGTQALVQKGPLLAGVATAMTAKTTVTMAVRAADQNPNCSVRCVGASSALAAASRAVVVAICPQHQPRCGNLPVLDSPSPTGLAGGNRESSNGV